MRIFVLPSNLALLSLLTFSYVSQSASYDVGQTYGYRYVAALNFNEPDNNLAKAMTYQVTTDVIATTVWQNPSNALDTLLLLQVKQPKLLVVPKHGKPGELKSHPSPLDKYTDGTIALHLQDGIISDFFSKSKPSPLLDFKTGIASLFQFQTQSKENVDEIDVSGKCKVTYKVSGSTIEKTKHNCETKSVMTHPNKVLGADVRSSIVTKYSMNKDHVISSAHATETHEVLTNSAKSNGISVVSEQTLKLVKHEDGSEKIIKASNINEAVRQLKKLTGYAMESSHKFSVDKVKREQENLCSKFSDIVRDKPSHFKPSNLAKIVTANTFLDVVRRSKYCTKDAFVKVLKNQKNKDILPQLLDVVAASQAPTAFPSVQEIMNFDSAESADLPERFLTAISVIPYPTADLLRQLMVLVGQGSRSEKLQETLALTLGSLTRKYFLNHGKDKDVEQIEALLIEKLLECPSDVCKSQYLRALGNAALPDTLPTLLALINDGGKCIPEALRVIQKLDTSALTDEARLVLVGVFHQLRAKQESTSRILAAEILLDNEPSKQEIQNILLAMTMDNSVEVNTYILSKIKEVAQKEESFRSKLSEVLRNPKVGNYDLLAPKGASTAFTNPLYAGESGLNASYGLHMEMVSGGLLKRSKFNIGLAFQDSELTLFSFGLFAGGLGSLAGEEASSNDAEEEETMSAGIQLGILDSVIRPYTFFTGQGELMGLVWSGTGGETTPILQGNFLLHDHRQEISLQNGFVLDVSLLGVLSYDMSGSIQISLWNRNSHSIVSNRGAVVVQTLVRLNSDFIESQAAVTTSAEGALDFLTDLEFYEAPFKMCTQMNQTPLSVRRTVSMIERIPGSKHRIRRTRKGTVRVPGKSYALHKKNSELCSAMLKRT